MTIIPGDTYGERATAGTLSGRSDSTPHWPPQYHVIEATNFTIPAGTDWSTAAYIIGMTGILPPGPPPRTALVEYALLVALGIDGGNQVQLPAVGDELRFGFGSIGE